MSEIAQLYRSDSYSHRVAAEVRAHAARRGLMQKDLARALGYVPSQITKRMRGQVPFTLEELATLATLFGLQPADLMPECTVRDSNPEPAGSRHAAGEGRHRARGLRGLGLRLVERSSPRTDESEDRLFGRFHDPDDLLSA